MILTSYGSGAEWVYNQLEEQPDLCTSSEPAYGYPFDALEPSETHVLPLCSTKIGCTLQFILEYIQKITSDSNTTGFPSFCYTPYKNVEYLDPLPMEHRKRLCNFINRLDGNYSKSAIFGTWVDAFVAEDKSLLGCFCPKGTQVKGLQIMGDWIATFPNEPPEISNLHATALAGSKVIRLERQNLFERYKSLITTQTAKLKKARTAEESDQDDQDQAIHIPVKEMIQEIIHMETVDRQADEWAIKYASDVLWVESNECEMSPTVCFKRIFEFLGLRNTEDLDDGLTTREKNLLDGIENMEEVRDALIVNGWGRFINE